jgi:5'-nucleotidase
MPAFPPPAHPRAPRAPCGNRPRGYPTRDDGGPFLILISNDDGYLSDGIRALAEALEGVDETLVVAPEAEQSASSHAISIHRPLRIRQVRAGWYAVDGTPTDCVVAGYHGLLDQTPDMVISGINHGPNMGEDVFYSGTVAAAIEGTLQGAPSIAVSLATRELADFVDPAQFVARLARRVLDSGLPGRGLLNVNLPHRPWSEVGGVRITRLGSRVYRDTLIKKVDPRGRDYYWIGGEDPVWEPREGTDFFAVESGYISVTPLRLDLTDEHALEDMQKWNVEA